MCLLLTQLLLIGSLEITFGLQGFNLQSWTTFILKVLCRDTVQLGGWSVIGTQWTEVCFTCFDLSHTFFVEGKEREKGSRHPSTCWRRWRRRKQDAWPGGWMKGRNEERVDATCLDQQIALQRPPHQGSDVRGQGSRPRHSLSVCRSPQTSPPFSTFLLPYSPSLPKLIPHTFSFFIALFPISPCSSVPVRPSSS